MTNRIALLALALALPLAACEDTDDPVVMDSDTITVETPDMDGAMNDAAAEIDEAGMEAEAAMEEGAAEMDAAADEMGDEAAEMEAEIDEEL